MGFCQEKLQLRGQLPGASIYDRCCQSLQEAARLGLPWEQRLALAMPASWMVNSPAPSPDMQAWLDQTAASQWRELVAAMERPAADWANADAQERDTIAALVAELAHDAHGLTGLSKILAALCPHTIPLMDDAALWFALGQPVPPHDPNAPRADVALFLPMVDWFTSQVVRHQATLAALAAQYPFGSLLPAQILDRLLWFESWGYHLFAHQALWRWISHGEREAIIPVLREDGLPPGFTTAPTSRQPWPDSASDDWRASAQELLDCVYEEAPDDD